MASDQPAPDFRRKLHRALERTHRQHAAQRALGTRRVTPPVRQPRRWPWLLVLAVLLCLAGFLLRKQSRRTDSAPTL